MTNLKENEVVIYLSDKDSSTTIMHRLLSIATQIDLSIIQNGKLNKEEYELVKLHPITRQLKDENLIILKDNLSTVYNLRSLVHELKKDGKKTVMLFVDSLQSLLYNESSREIKDVMLDLNLLSEEYECPLICTMPLGRSVEHRTSHYPRLTDLDAKMVNIASRVFFLMRPDYYQFIDASESDISETHLVVAQNEGQLDTILLGMNRKTLTMGELAQNTPIN
jgi:replicative DNA helicase